MAKGAVGIIAGYWPEEVLRYLGVPGLSLDDGLVARPSKRRASHMALRVGSDSLDYGQLGADVDAFALAIRAALTEKKERVAIAVSSPADLLRAFLGTVRARALPVLIDPALPTDELAAQTVSSRPDLVIADTAFARLPIARGRWTTVAPSVLGMGEKHPRPERRRLDLKGGTIGLHGPGGAAFYHSNSSLLAWAISWGAFLPLAEDDVFLTLEPLHRWAGLAVAMASLFRGATCAAVESPTRALVTEQLTEHRPGYVMMSFAQAAEYAAAGDEALRGALGRSVKGVFVSLEGRFEVLARRRIESAFGVPVLTVLGSAATGPVLASHPSWYLDEAMGLPITNVDVWPLSPDTSRALEVPWEAIDQAGLGVRSPMLAVERDVGGGQRAPVLPDDWFALGSIAMMDPAGLFYLYPWR